MTDLAQYDFSDMGWEFYAKPGGVVGEMTGFSNFGFINSSGGIDDTKMTSPGFIDLGIEPSIVCAIDQYFAPVSSNGSFASGCITPRRVI